MPEPQVSESAAPRCCAPASAPLLEQETAERLARALKALGHPIRLQIMHILSHLGGQVCVCDIEEQFEIKQPTVSHHLRTLREAGLVEAEQRGLYQYYRVRPERLASVQRQLKAFGR